jgi:hypothetical protein
MREKQNTRTVTPTPVRYQSSIDAQSVSRKNNAFLPFLKTPITNRQFPPGPVYYYFPFQEEDEEVEEDKNNQRHELQ